MKKIIVLVINSFILLGITFAGNNICGKLEVNNFNQQTDRFIYFNSLNNYTYLKKKEDGKYVIVYNGKESKEYNNINNIKVFNNGKDFFFIAKKEDGKYVIVYNGKESKEYNNINISQVFILKSDNSIFSKFNIIGSNYVSVVYIDKLHKLSFNMLVNNLNENGIMFVNDNGMIKWLDNGEIQKFNKNKAKQQLNNVWKLGQQFLFNGEKYIKYSYIDISTLNFNHKGDYTLAATTSNGKDVIIYNGKNYNNEDEVKKLIYSENLDNKYNKNIYVKKLKGNGKFVVMYNGVKGKEYNWITNLIISHDGKHYAYMARYKKKFFIIDDGKEIPNIDNVYDIKFLPNNNLIYVSYKGKNKINELVYNGDVILTGQMIDVKSTLLKNNYLLYIGSINYNKSVFIARKLCTNTLTSTYIDNVKYNYYKKLINEKLGKRIERIPLSRRQLIGKKVDIILDKIKNSNKYTKEMKIKKVSLFTAFKDILLGK